MRGAPTHGSRARAAALFALGALAVHQLRYLLVDGSGAHAHGYLELLVPLTVATTVAAIAVSILATLARRCLPTPLDPTHTTERAAAYALGLLTVYFAQELAEGIVVAEHGVLAGVLGAGSWLALPLAMAFGALAALAGGWLDRVELRVALAGRRARPRPRARGARPRRPTRRAPQSLVLGFELSPRPPPAAAAG